DPTLLWPWPWPAATAPIRLDFLVHSKLHLQDSPQDKLDWLKVGLTLGTSIFLWVYLIKKHNEDVLEYKTRKGLE
uniref:NADH dehydrogenase [ubiquinone] 1 subunit C1, mitochondrial n=1 Tax=Catagonus wagneri TaxID=51154 RepID=A0A8C3VNK4_9CETA